MSQKLRKKEPTTAQIKDVVEIVRKDEKQNFFRALVSDNNNINEGSIVGFIAFVIFIFIVLADVFFPGFNVAETYITHLVAVIVGGLGIGGAKSYREVMRKTISIETPD